MERTDKVSSLKFSIRSTVTTALLFSSYSAKGDFKLGSDVDFALKVQEIEDASVDYAESKLHEFVEMGDRASVMFFLKAKGKERGYH